LRYNAAKEKNVMSKQTVELIVRPCGEWGGVCVCDDDCADCADFEMGKQEDIEQPRVSLCEAEPCMCHDGCSEDCQAGRSLVFVKIYKNYGHVIIHVPATVLVEDGENEKGSITFVMSEEDYEGMGGTTATKAYALRSFASESGLAANRSYALEYAYGIFMSAELYGAGNVVEHIW